jgi:hypothetical protein
MSGGTKTGVAVALGVTLIGILGVTSSAPGLAKAADAKAQSCFFASDINGFEAPDDHTVYIRVGASDLYKLDLTPHCTGLRFRQDIAIRSSPSEGGFICTPLQAEVVYRESGIPEECPVTALHKLSPAEIAATPKKDLP